MVIKFTNLQSLAIAPLCIAATVTAAISASSGTVGDEVIEGQRSELAVNTDGAGFGPQSPRDIGSVAGTNMRVFSKSPSYTEMNLCNIHFHENAEHKGGQFTRFAGNGDGHGYGTGYKYDGELTEAQLAPVDQAIGASDHGDLVPGDTIEVHFVHTTAQLVPGPTLGSCLSESLGNPQLRVEAVVVVLVNDATALDFTDLAKVEKVNGYYQSPHIPNDLGSPVEYTGSTTGPSYNTKGSPFQVGWSVRPNVAFVDINSVGAWLGDNMFDETYAHGVRNLVINPDLLSPIEN